MDPTSNSKLVSTPEGPKLNNNETGQKQVPPKFPTGVAALVIKAKDQKIDNLNPIKKVSETKLHYSSEATSLGAKIHAFIRKAVAFVKGQSAIDNKKYDLNTNEGVAEKLLTTYSKEEIKEAVKTLQKSSDFRFNNEKDDRFSFDANKFNDALDRTADEKTLAPRRNIEAPEVKDLEDLNSKEDKKPTVKEAVVKDIAIKLAALVERKPVTTTPFENIKGEKCFMQQEVGSVKYNDKNEATFVRGSSSSAEAQKKEKTQELANQGSVVLNKTGKNGETVSSKYLLGRSARTSTEGQIKDSSIGIISDKFKAEGEKGFPKKTDAGGNTYYEFQKLDFSFMDSSLSKQIIGRLLSGFAALFKGRPLEDEKMFNDRHMKAVEKMWDPKNVKTDERGPYIEHKINIDGEIKTFREYKSLFMNVVVSSQANDTSKLEAAYKTNIGNSIDMSKQLLQKLIDDPTKDPVQQSDLKRTMKALDEYKINPSPKNMDMLKDRISLLTEGDKKVAPFEPKTMLALQGIEALVTGSMGGESVNSIAGSKAQILYSFAIADLLQMGASVKCKSGNDRTAIGVCIRTVAAEYEEKHGVPFDPMTKNPKERAEFGESFSVAMSKLGASNVYASRGPSGPDNPRPVLKSKSHPLLHHEMSQFGDSKEANLFALGAYVNLK